MADESLSPSLSPRDEIPDELSRTSLAGFDERKRKVPALLKHLAIPHFRSTAKIQPQSTDGQSFEESVQETFAKIFQFAIEFGFLNADSLSRAYSMLHATKKLRASSKSHSKALVSFIDRFLRMPQRFSRSWADIFYTRMLLTQSVLTNELFATLPMLVNHYASLLSADERKALTATHLLEDFLAFCDSHQSDPDNALIGMQPAHVLLRKFANPPDSEDPSMRFEDLQTRDKLLQLVVSWNQLDDLTAIGRKVRAFTAMVRRKEIIDLKRGDLLIVLVPLKHPRTQTSNKREDVSLMLSQREVAQFEKQGLEAVFARFIELANNNTQVHFCSSPLEEEVEVADIQNVCAVNQEVAKHLGSERSMKRLIYDAADDFADCTKVIINVLTDDWMKEHGIDLEMLDKCTSNEVSMMNLLKLKTTLAALEQLQKQQTQQQRKQMREQQRKEGSSSDNSPTSDGGDGSGSASACTGTDSTSGAESAAESSETLALVIERAVQDIVEEFSANIDSFKLYAPLKQETLESLRSIPYFEFARNRIQKFVGVCHTALDQLQIELRTYLNGQKKYELTRWWHGLISKSVNDYLKELGFDRSGMPVDYIDSPPENLDLVHNNLRIIQEVMDVANDKHHVVDTVIEPLKREIYAKIDVFVECLKIVLIDANFAHGQTLAKFDLTSYEQALIVAREQQTISEQLWQSLDSICKDLDYLREMGELEQTFGKQQGRLAMTAAVPISGLIMNLFHRLENEMKTIIEVWCSQSQIDLRRRTSSSTLQSQMRQQTPASAGSLANSPQSQRYSCSVITRSFTHGAANKGSVRAASGEVVAVHASGRSTKSESNTPIKKRATSSRPASVVAINLSTASLREQLTPAAVSSSDAESCSEPSKSRQCTSDESADEVRYRSAAALVSPRSAMRLQSPSRTSSEGRTRSATVAQTPPKLQSKAPQEEIEPLLVDEARQRAGALANEPSLCVEQLELSEKERDAALVSESSFDRVTDSDPECELPGEVYDSEEVSVRLMPKKSKGNITAKSLVEAGDHPRRRRTEGSANDTHA